MINRIQQPSNPSNWLYKDEGEERLFSKNISLPNNMPDWLECTNKEKLAWEELNKQEEPLPEEVEEPQEAEVVE